MNREDHNDVNPPLDIINYYRITDRSPKHKSKILYQTHH